LTNAVQTLAGVLLPSASVFLLLLCNDRAVLGPWAQSRNLNLFTGVVVAALVMLSLILTLSVLFTGITESQLLAIFIGGCIAAAVTAIGVRLAIPARPPTPAAKAQGPTAVADRVDWRMPPLDELPPAQLTKLNVIWLIVLRAYLFVAAGHRANAHHHARTGQLVDPELSVRLTLGAGTKQGQLSRLGANDFLPADRSQPSQCSQKHWSGYRRRQTALPLQCHLSWPHGRDGDRRAGRR
jgi:hypothetical protein